MKSFLRKTTCIAAALLVVLVGVTASASRCTVCRAMPCCQSDDTDQAHVLPRMPCCDAAARAETATRPPIVTLDELLLFLPSLRFSFTSSRPIVARVYTARVASSAPPLYRTKCSLLL